ncbi:MAG: haloacid dehalogenase-like hydrolase [Bacteroidales bacterium]|nr:haloacid dehalogenase-like hydrolase [Bacteroidales bacterium]
MTKKQPIVALVYDFDGTLSPGNMQEFGFIQAIGKTPEEFWETSDAISSGQEMSHILAYMKLMIDEARYAGISLKRDSFVSFGRAIKLFPGVKEWFSLINEYGHKKGVIVEHYINSSGLTEMIEGTEIAKEFKKIFASSFWYDQDNVATWPAVAVDFTSKTQFLFKITKGILDISDKTKVNESQKDESKPVPFSNMIYFGDGETDIPCMKIVKMFGGNSIAVYKPERKEKFKTAQKLLRQERVNFICKADYSMDSEIWKVVTTIIDKVKMEDDFARLQRKLRNKSL